MINNIGIRPPLVVGNWKLNGNRQMIKTLVSYLCKNLTNLSGCNVVIAPPEIYLDFTKNVLKDSHIFLGAQNVDINISGAFTGETSAEMLKDIGVQYVIIGHSERRIYHKESDELIAKKFSILKKMNLIPILCIGETISEKNSGKTKKVCSRQIDAIIETQGVEAFENSVIAYEPVWAIGSSNSADPMLIQEIHKFIRNYIAKVNVQIAKQIIIQYGGSVNIFNASKIFSQPDIDGVLVGNASLQASSFLKIIQTAFISRCT